MLKQKAMIAANYDALTSTSETGRKVASTFVPGNLNELVRCFDMVNNLPETNAIQNGLRKKSGMMIMDAWGGSETNPEPEPVWMAPDTPVLAVEGRVEPVATRFRGYRLDEQRRPVFIYELLDGDARFAVAEQPIPRVVEGRTSLLRRFVIEGPAGRALVVYAPSHRFVESGEPADSARPLVLDADGTATFTLELTW